MLLAIITMILGFLGIYGFFTSNFILVIIGGVTGLIDNLVCVSFGKQKSLKTAIFAVAIGAIYSLSVALPLWLGVLLGLCFEAAISQMCGWIALIIFWSKSQNKKI